MALCGISKSMFFRLWTRAPRTTMLSFDMGSRRSAGEESVGKQHFACPPPQMRLRPAAETFDYIWLRIAAGEHGRDGARLSACCDNAAPFETGSHARGVMPAHEITFAL